MLSAADPIRYRILQNQRRPVPVSSTAEYWLYDTFTTDLAAGSVSGTAAEPGPGTRTVTDTESKLYLSGGSVYLGSKASSSDGDPGLWYGSLARASGLSLIIKSWNRNSGTTIDYVGWDNNTSALQYDGFKMDQTFFTVMSAGSVGARFASISGITNNLGLSIVLRSAGSFLLYKPNSGNWTLGYCLETGTTTPLYPCIPNRNDVNLKIDSIFVPKTTWLPIPTVSDGFSGSNGDAINGRTTDGKGHVEENGGSGVTWTGSGSEYVTNNTAYIPATGFCWCDTGLTNGIFIHSWTINDGTNTCYLVSRGSSAWTDYVTTGWNGSGSISVVKTIAGTPTTLATTAVTYSAGKRLIQKWNGTELRSFYNEALVGAALTISDAELQVGTRVSCGTSGAGDTGTLENFQAWPGGERGEYSVLDAL